MFQSAASTRPWRARIAVGVALVAVVGLSATVSANPDEARGQGSGASTGALLVELHRGVGDAAAASLLSAAGATEIGRLDDLAVRVVDVPAARRAESRRMLADDPRVLSVEDDVTAQATVIPRDPHWAQAWGPRLIRSPEAWNITTGRSTTIIAIVDTGVDPRQPDLRGRVLHGWDFQNNDPNAYDDNGHGTAVAGVAAAAANDGVGIAGICWQCRILPVKVLNSNGSGTHSNIAAGIVWAADHGADVINMSVAGSGSTTTIALAVDYARRHGVVVVAAAGNEGSTRRFYPAGYTGVLSVAATSGADVLYNWSNRGSWVKLAAPGCAFTGKPGPAWTWWCGTSFATPVVAGTAALIKSARPGMTRAQIENTLLTSVVRVRGVVNGRIDAARALRNAMNLTGSTPSPTPKPRPTPTPGPAQSSYDWRGHLDGGNHRQSRTFRVSGREHVRFDWSSDETLWLTFVDRDGHVVQSVHGDSGKIEFELSLRSGEYAVTVGQWSDNWTWFRVRMRT